MLYKLFYQYLQIALLRLTPQELPGQPSGLVVAVAGAFVTALAGLLFAYDFGTAVFRSVLALLVPAVLMYVLLSAKGMQNRFVQSYSALCGTAAIIYVFALPFMPVFFGASIDTLPGKSVVMLILLLDVWALVITAHILLHTLNVGFATGMTLSFFMMLITIIVIESLSPSKLTVESQSQLGQHVRGSVHLAAAAMDRSYVSGNLFNQCVDL